MVFIYFELILYFLLVFLKLLKPDGHITWKMDSDVHNSCVHVRFIGHS